MGFLDSETLRFRCPETPGTLLSWDPKALEPWCPGTQGPWSPSVPGPGTLEPRRPQPIDLAGVPGQGPWSPGVQGPWRLGVLGPRDPGTQEQRNWKEVIGTKETWSPGVLGPWSPGVPVPTDPGAQAFWDSGTHGPRDTNLSHRLPY